MKQILIKFTGKQEEKEYWRIINAKNKLQIKLRRVVTWKELLSTLVFKKDFLTAQELLEASDRL